MPAGDVAVYRGSSAGSAQQLSGTAVDLEWDTTVLEDAIFSITGDNTITLGEAGHYFVAYNIAAVTDTGDTDRSQIRGRIELEGTDLTYGACGNYMRRFSGHDECYMTGAAIIDAAQDDELQIEVFTTDSTSNTPITELDKFGISILKLDEDYAYVRLSKDAAGSVSTGSFQAITWINANDTDENSGGVFTVPVGPSADITIGEAGHYLATYSMLIENTTGSRANGAAYLSFDGVEDRKTRAFGYIRDAEGCQQTVMSWCGIFRTDKADVVLNLEYRHENTGSGTVTPIANGTTLTIAKLPPSAAVDYLRMTTIGSQEANSATIQVNFEFEYEKDDPPFEHSTVTNPDNVTVSITDRYLFFAGANYERRTSLTNGNRYAPHQEWRVNSTKLTYGSASGYNRGANASQDCKATGQTAVAIMDLTAGDVIDLNNDNLCTTSDASGDFVGGGTGLQALRISTLVPSAALTLAVNDRLILCDRVHWLFQRAFFLAVNDCLVLGDEFRWIRTLFRELGDDTLGLTDEAVFAGILRLAVNDTLGLTDQQILQVARRLAVDDDLGLTDAQGLVLGIILGHADTLGLTDSVDTVQAPDPRPRFADFAGQIGAAGAPGGQIGFSPADAGQAGRP